MPTDYCLFVSWIDWIHCKPWKVVYWKSDFKNTQKVQYPTRYLISMFITMYPLQCPEVLHDVSWKNVDDLWVEHGRACYFSTLTSVSCWWPLVERELQPQCAVKLFLDELSIVHVIFKDIFFTDLIKICSKVQS